MDTAMNDLLYRLLDELATLWPDLCQLAGEEPPVAVATLLDEAWVATATD